MSLTPSIASEETCVEQNTLFSEVLSAKKTVVVSYLAELCCSHVTLAPRLLLTCRLLVRKPLYWRVVALLCAMPRSWVKLNCSAAAQPIFSSTSPVCGWNCCIFFSFVFVTVMMHSGTDTLEIPFSQTWRVSLRRWHFLQWEQEVGSCRLHIKELVDESNTTALHSGPTLIYQHLDKTLHNCEHTFNTPACSQVFVIQNKRNNMKTDWMWTVQTPNTALLNVFF